MTKLSLAKATLFFLITIFTVNVSTAQKFKKYYQKSGKLEQKISGNSNGTLTVYWDEYGYKEVKIEKTITKMFGIKSESNKTNLMIGSTMYEWDENSNTITKMKNDIAETWEKDNYTADKVGAMSEATLKQLGYEKRGTETILGKTCDIWEGIGKSWVWKNLNLKAEVKVLGAKITYESVSLDLDYNVPESVFELPKDKTIVNAEDQIPDDGSEESKQAKEMFKGIFGDED